MFGDWIRRGNLLIVSNIYLAELERCLFLLNILLEVPKSMLVGVGRGDGRPSLSTVAAN
jgi:hypothetical protein